MKIIDQLTPYLAAFIDELVKVGVNQAVISPGSRSTPISMLMAEHPDMETYLNVDERSAAFFALGIAKANHKPVALICTSGTATANYLPAIVEAYYSRVPLIVLTADRPHELRNVGAPQAIDQLHLYGKYTKAFIEMALPENNLNMVNYSRTMAAKSAAMSMSAPKGPVHLNFPLREPLVPDLAKENLWTGEQVRNHPIVSVINGKPALDETYFQALFANLEGVEKGIIVCGPIDEPEFVDAVMSLSEQLNYPIFADPLSQLRSGGHTKEHVIECYDTILRNEQMKDNFQPEVVIRFGAMPVSKAFTLFLKSTPNCRQIVVDGEGGWREPSLTATDMVFCDETLFCKMLGEIGMRTRKSPWLNDWVHLNGLARNALFQVRDETDLSEGKIFTELGDLLPDDSILFVGNSMPVRDLDTYFSNNPKRIRMMANRGANGIDGVVSTALGASIHHTPLVLAIGDLSFYHDMNGLLAAKLHHLDATIILINNDGGGIFSFLPQAEEKTHFESLFGTPIGLDFEYAVKMYHGDFSRVKNWGEFRESVTHALNSKGLNVIEVPTIRAENVSNHRKLWKNVSQEINEYLKDKDSKLT